MEAVAALLAHVHSTAFRPEPRVTPPIAQVRWTPQALSPHNLGRRAHGTRPEAASPGGAPWLGSRHAAKLLPALNGRPRALAAHRLGHVGSAWGVCLLYTSPSPRDAHES
eukprot:4756488-Prymnesium_polylepis.1